MIYLKDNPVGIDIQIQRIQQRLYDKLSSSLNCEIHAYGRAYKTNNKGSIKPEVYKEGRYNELLTNSQIKGLHFFFIEDNESSVLTRTCMSSNTIDLIVIVDDLSKVRNDVQHYPDEEIKEEVKSYIKSYFEITSVVKNEDALDGFDISKLNFIYPYFVFRITGTINNY